MFNLIARAPNLNTRCEDGDTLCWICILLDHRHTMVLNTFLKPSEVSTGIQLSRREGEDLGGGDMVE